MDTKQVKITEELPVVAVTSKPKCESVDRIDRDGDVDENNYWIAPCGWYDHDR